jgi:hypothetical protein
MSDKAKPSTAPPPVAEKDKQAMADRAARLRDAIAMEHGVLSDSAAAIRQDRDRRG